MSPAAVRAPRPAAEGSGVADRSVFDRLPRDPHPAPRGAARGGAGRMAGAIRQAYAAARHAEVKEILGDPATFCSSRGVGLSDFARETPWRPPSLVLERDPPEHDRARAVLNRALSATVMRSLRARFAEAADALAGDLARRAVSTRSPIAPRSTR